MATHYKAAIEKLIQKYQEEKDELLQKNMDECVSINKPTFRNGIIGNLKEVINDLTKILSD